MDRTPRAPTVVIAGGREPVHWLPIPAIRCCTTSINFLASRGGCWKSGTHPWATERSGINRSDLHTARRRTGPVHGPDHCGGCRPPGRGILPKAASHGPSPRSGPSPDGKPSVPPLALQKHPVLHRRLATGVLTPVQSLVVPKAQRPTTPCPSPPTDSPGDDLRPRDGRSGA